MNSSYFNVDSSMFSQYMFEENNHSQSSLSAHNQREEMNDVHTFNSRNNSHTGSYDQFNMNYNQKNHYNYLPSYPSYTENSQYTEGLQVGNQNQYNIQQSLNQAEQESLASQTFFYEANNNSNFGTNEISPFTAGVITDESIHHDGLISFPLTKSNSLESDQYNSFPIISTDYSSTESCSTPQSASTSQLDSNCAQSTNTSIHNALNSYSIPSPNNASRMSPLCTPLASPSSTTFGMMSTNNYNHHASSVSPTSPKRPCSATKSGIDSSRRSSIACNKISKNVKAKRASIAVIPTSVLASITPSFSKPSSPSSPSPSSSSPSPSPSVSTTTTTSSSNDINTTDKNIKPSTSIQHTTQPGPIPASKPSISKDPITGEELLTFSYSKQKIIKRFTIKCGSRPTSESLSSLSQQFLLENCVYPRAMCLPEEYKGNRYQYEKDCNEIGWNLAWLNPEIRDHRGLIQRAVDSWRNTRTDKKLRSRRVRKNELTK